MYRDPKRIIQLLSVIDYTTFSTNIEKIRGTDEKKWNQFDDFKIGSRALVVNSERE